MSEQPLESQNQNRRRMPRKRTLQRGKIIYGEGAFTLDCLIRDISGKGARITVDKGISMPMHVYLIDLQSGMAYAAEISYIRAPSFGLNFLRSYRISELTDPSLRFLHHCWVGVVR
jgi:hypothetical protein